MTNKINFADTIMRQTSKDNTGTIMIEYESPIDSDDFATNHRSLFAKYKVAGSKIILNDIKITHDNLLGLIYREPMYESYTFTSSLPIHYSNGTINHNPTLNDYTSRKQRSFLNLLQEFCTNCPTLSSAVC